MARNIRYINNWELFFNKCFDLDNLIHFSNLIEDFKISKIDSILLDFDLASIIKIKLLLNLKMMQKLFITIVQMILQDYNNIIIRSIQIN